jgi:hypothetical protein
MLYPIETMFIVTTGQLIIANRINGKPNVSFFMYLKSLPQTLHVIIYLTLLLSAA